ncbi:uncharacterized protein Dyak_GE11168 [Drosophila yakuba]|uniref:Uncharacterized protein n=1 Tax=Drosophila yakuba TaxID=7245 RepID=B4IUS3_DROYA|nr:uncharacterized protein Dyak_GE11168 [Drosophila yakuba]
MANRNLVKVFLLVALLGLSLMPFCQAHPKRGRKRAFGVGLLGGALAGAVIGNVVAKSHQAPAAAPAAPVAVVHHHYPPAAPVAPAPAAQPDPKKMTVVETGQPDANGCYTQTIREPNSSNPKTYTETQHLICPTLQLANQPAPAIAPSVAQVPVMPQPSPVFPAGSQSVVPAHVVPAAPAGAPVPIAPAAPVVPVAPAAPAAPAAVPLAPGAPVAVHPAAPAIAHPAAVPVAPIASPVQQSPGQPQVILLSKKTVYYPKKRSSAPTLNIPQGVLAMVVIFYSIKAFTY